MRALPPLTALRAFEAAARLLSFQDAARELGLTPTAISHQVRQLEEYCGQPLFRRRPRPLSLSPAGARLLPPVSQGLDLFVEGLGAAAGSPGRRLRVTATNAFAARWITPRMASWRESHPGIGLDLLGTDALLDFDKDQVDVAVRYARQPPKDLISSEIGRDKYIVVASPKLVGPGPVDLSPHDLLRFPLIDGEWPDRAAHPPMWFEWVRVARETGGEVPDLDEQVALSFREDLHGIEAAIAGLGIAICSDLLVANDLAAGSLIQVSTLSLEGYGFFVAYRPRHPRLGHIRAFEAWLSSQFRLTLEEAERAL